MGDLVEDGEVIWPGDQWDRKSRETGKPMLSEATSILLSAVARHNTQSALPVVLIAEGLGQFTLFAEGGQKRVPGRPRPVASPILRTPPIELRSAVSLNHFAQHADRSVLTFGYSGDKKTKGAALVF